MNSQFFVLISALFYCLSGQSAEQPEKKSNAVFVGTTLFVSGHFSKWGGKINYTWEIKPGETKIEKIVFVDITSDRQEKMGFAEVFKGYAQTRGWDTVAVGRCDLFCARLLAAGKNRTLAQGAYIDLQVPVDYDTKKLEPRYPNTQFALYEKNPLSAANKEIFYEAFTAGGMTGGLRVDGKSAQFCKSRDPDIECKNYQIDGVSLGILTSGELVKIGIPFELMRQ